MENTFTLPSLSTIVFYLSCFLSFPIFFGCGGTEDLETESPIVAEIKPTHLELAEAVLAPNDTLLRVESIFEQLNAEEEHVPVGWKSTDLVSRAAYARFLLRSGKINIPRDWYKTEDPVLNAEYRRAQLTKQFGDIPAVRIVSDFTLKQALGLPRWTSLDEYITELEAQYYLFPNETNLRTLQEHRKMKKEGVNVIFVSTNAEFQLMTTVADFMQKLADQQPITDVECNEFLNAHAELRQLQGDQPLPLHEEYAILEAQDQLQLEMDKLAQRRLETFRRAKAAGIPFHDIDWEDGVDR